MKCTKCNRENCIKKGKRNFIQRYYCKDCRNHFQNHYHYRAYNSNTDKMITTLLKEGCGVRSISRIVQISKNTVLSRILSISKQIKPPIFLAQNQKYEIDELWTFAGNKSNVVWITYCIEKTTKRVISFMVGRKTKEVIGSLGNKIVLLNPKAIYTDRLSIYKSLIPKRLHRVFRFCTNTIERFNLTLRTHIKRLSRRTICFSKKRNYLEAHLKIYFWS